MLAGCRSKPIKLSLLEISQLKADLKASIWKSALVIVIKTSNSKMPISKAISWRLQSKQTVILEFFRFEISFSILEFLISVLILEFTREQLTVASEFG